MSHHLRGFRVRPFALGRGVARLDAAIEFMARIYDPADRITILDGGYPYIVTRVGTKHVVIAGLDDFKECAAPELQVFTNAEFVRHADEWREELSDRFQERTNER